MSNNQTIEKQVFLNWALFKIMKFVILNCFFWGGGGRIRMICFKNKLSEDFTQTRETNSTILIPKKKNQLSTNHVHDSLVKCFR